MQSDLRNHCLCERDIELRTFTQIDAPAFVAAVLESKATVGKWMPWAHEGYSQTDALAWFDKCAASLFDQTAYEYGIFRESTGEFLGGAGLNGFNKPNNFCNLGYWVRQSAQRQGIASVATRLLLRLAFEQLGLTRVEIVIAEGNMPSIGVAQRAGGKHECVAANRLVISGKPVSAHVYSFVPSKAVHLSNDSNQLEH